MRWRRRTSTITKAKVMISGISFRLACKVALMSTRRKSGLLGRRSFMIARRKSVCKSRSCTCGISMRSHQIVVFEESNSVTTTRVRRLRMTQHHTSNQCTQVEIPSTESNAHSPSFPTPPPGTSPTVSKKGSFEIPKYSRGDQSVYVTR